MSIVVRPATPDDADAIGRLHVRAWQVGYRALLEDELLDGLDVDAWITRRREHLDAPRADSFNRVAEVDGAVVGWAAAGPSRDDDRTDREAELYALYVHPDRWSQGVAQALMTSVVEEVDRRELAEISLWVLEENVRARRFYEAAGFTTDGAQKPAGVRGITDPSVRYRRELHPANPRRWVEVAGTDEIRERPRAVDADGLRLLVGVTGSDVVYAVDDRCPHEGYPLAQGVLKDCVLTCAWHNWKFDVRDGQNILGGEGIRSWPVRIVGDVVQVDVTRPPPELVVPQLLSSLREGLRDGSVDRCLRDLARLLQAGESTASLFVEIARDDARRAEYGSTHTLPLCGDLLEIAAPDGTDALFALAPAVAMSCEANVRMPPRVRSAPTARGDEAALLRIVEAENVELAESVVRGLVKAGRRLEVDAWLLGVAAQHFLSFGHPLIYLMRMRPLLRHLDDEALADVWGGWVVRAVNGTREDTLPFLRVYRRSLEAREDTLNDLLAAADPDAPFDEEGLVRAVLDGTAKEACEALWTALEGGVSGSTVARALVLASAARLLRFDLQVEFDGSTAEGWIWATHRLTFASAVREAADLWPDRVDILRLLLQAVAFIHSGKGMDCPPERRPVIAPKIGSAEDLRDALSGRRADEAMALARTAAWSPEERHALLDPGLSDRFVRPISMAHAIKTAAAALREHDALGNHPDRSLPAVATARFLASPVIEQRRRDQVRAALRFVLDGKPPKKLTQ